MVGVLSVVWSKGLLENVVNIFQSSAITDSATSENNYARRMLPFNMTTFFNKAETMLFSKLSKLSFLLFH